MVLRYSGEEIAFDDTIVTDIQFETEDGYGSLPMGELGYYLWGSRALYNEIQNYSEGIAYESIDLDLEGDWDDYTRYTEQQITALVLTGGLRHLRQNWDELAWEPIRHEPLIIWVSLESPIRIRVISKAGGGTIPPIIAQPSVSSEEDTPVEEVERTSLREVGGAAESTAEEYEYDPYGEVWHIKFRPFDFRRTFQDFVNLVLEK